MKISEQSISAIGKIITGDGEISPYRSGMVLVKLFNEFGFNEIYEKGFPSRWFYAEEKIRELNDSLKLDDLICEVLDPRIFMDTEFNVDDAIEYINKRLKYDGFEITIIKDLPRIKNIKDSFVECDEILLNLETDGHQFIEEQIKKSEQKIQEGDNDGAITNARSLIEAVLSDIEKQYNENPPRYDGDLIKLYKRVQKYLNLTPANQNIEQPFKQVLSGLISTINGLASISNSMGDRHVRQYKPEAHHARLVVNSSRTFINFIFDTNQYQKNKNLIT